MASAPSTATGKPTSASRLIATKRGPGLLAVSDSAGAMHKPSESPRTRRVGTGTAESPKAGIRVTAGVARARPSAQARGSTPLSAKTASQTSARLSGACKGAMAIDAGARCALTVARPHRYRDGFRYFHSWLRDGTGQLQLRLEDGRALRARGRRDTRRARLRLRGPWPARLADVRGHSRLWPGEPALRQDSVRHDALGARRANLALASPAAAGRHAADHRQDRRHLRHEEAGAGRAHHAHDFERRA